MYLIEEKKNSEYLILEFVFSKIEDKTTKNITPIISHIAKVLIPFFNLTPPLKLAVNEKLCFECYR